jgi:uncharacterized protein
MSSTAARPSDLVQYLASRGGATGPLQPLSPLHVFAFRGAWFAFFVRTGDLVGLSEPAARVLGWCEKGLGRREIDERAHSEFGSELAERVLADLEKLEQADLLHPNVSVTPKERRNDIEELLRHQPRNLMFFVTEACNLKCTYCYESNQGVHDRARTLKQVDAERTIDAYFAGSPRRQGLTITFFGGEPLLNPTVIRESVAYAKRKASELGKEVGFTMTTNLTLLTEDMADFLARERFHVMVSLDGDKEGNDRYRKTVDGQGTYDVVKRNLQVLIAKMREHGTRLPKIRATLTAENSDPIAAEAHLRSLGTPLVMIGETHGTANGRYAYDVNANSAARDANRRAAENVVDTVLRQLSENPGTLPDMPPSVVEGLRTIHAEVTREAPHGAARPKLCGVCRNMKAVTPGGDLYPCHRYVGMEAFKLGNLHKGGVDQVKERDYYERLYAVYEEKCAPCWLRNLCGGQCPWYLSSADGSVRTPDEDFCDTIRDGYEQRLGLYATLLGSFPEAFTQLMGTSATSMSGAHEGDLANDCSAPVPTTIETDRDGNTHN